MAERLKSDPPKPTVWVLDATNQILRCVLAAGPDLSSSTGEPTRGTFAFTQFLIKLVRDAKPDYLFAALDGPRAKLHRRAFVPEYKADRDSNGPMDPAVGEQFRRCVEIIRAFGIPLIRDEGWEADDVAATIAAGAARNGLSTAIVSQDRDLYQLIDRRTFVFDPRRDYLLERADVRQILKIAPSQVPLYLALVGKDAPGILGIGDKRAQMLLESGAETPVDLIDYANETTFLPEKARVALLEAHRSGRLESLYRLHVLRSDLGFFASFNPASYRFRGLNFDGARPIFRSLGFVRLANIG